MPRLRIALLVLIFALCPAARADLLSPAQARQIAGADIVILGEVHDNALHHQGQGALITRIAPRAVVFEMLSPTQAEIANDTPRDDLESFAQAIDWAGSGWPAFDLYAPVFEALGTTPVVGAEVPRATVRAAFSDGAAAAFGPDAARFGLDVPLSGSELTRRKSLQFDAHCAAMPMEMMGSMVEAQRLRDARFSQSALEALATYGAPVVVIAGHGHARRDWGMPALIAQAAPNVRTLAIGFVEQPHAGQDPRFDITLPTAAAQRGDPCAQFKQ